MSDTKQPDKFFIISTDLDDYDATIKSMNLPPGQCFYCEDTFEAWRSAKVNKMKGINASVIISPSYTRGKA